MGLPPFRVVLFSSVRRHCAPRLYLERRKRMETCMSDRLVVRDIVPGDFDQWLPLWHGYNAFYERVGPTALPHDITQTTWSRFFDPNEPVFAAVAEADRKLMG